MSTEKTSTPNNDDVSNEELKERVLDNFQKLVSDMRAADISDWLIQERIISVEEWHGIEAFARTRTDINRAFLRLLLNLQNPRTFLVFKMALKETESLWLQELLDQPSKGTTMDQLKREEIFFASDKDEGNAKERDEQLKELRKQLKNKLQENENLTKQVVEIQEKLNLEKEVKKQYKKELEGIKQQLNKEKKTNVYKKKAMDEMKEPLQRKQDLRDRKDREDNKENVMDPQMKNSNSAKQTPRSKKENVRPLSSPEKAMPSKKKQQKEITSYFSP